MSLDQQQVNVQELQRLNEAIALCMDTLRRVAPQLGQVQSVLAQIGAQIPALGPQLSPLSQIPPWALGISPWHYGQAPLYGNTPFMTPQFTQVPVHAAQPVPQPHAAAPVLDVAPGSAAGLVSAAGLRLRKRQQPL